MVKCFTIKNRRRSWSPDVVPENVVTSASAIEPFGIPLKKTLEISRLETEHIAKEKGDSVPNHSFSEAIFDFRIFRVGSSKTKRKGQTGKHTNTTAGMLEPLFLFEDFWRSKARSANADSVRSSFGLPSSKKGLTDGSLPFFTPQKKKHIITFNWATQINPNVRNQDLRILYILLSSLSSKKIHMQYDGNHNPQKQKPPRILTSHLDNVNVLMAPNPAPLLPCHACHCRLFGASSHPKCLRKNHE